MPFSNSKNRQEDNETDSEGNGCEFIFGLDSANSE
jgi:hypothetical protein